VRISCALNSSVYKSERFFDKERRGALSQRVAIVAAVQSKFVSSHTDLSIGEMIWDVVEGILKETGLKFEAQGGDRDGPAIDKIISCSEDYWQGRTISDMLYHMELGALGMSLTKVAGDGAFAVYHGAVSILSGKYDIALVIAWRKESETVRSVIENAGFDPIYLRPLGIDFLTAAAMQANCYIHRYGATEEQFAEVVVKNKGNAFLNPYAQAAMKLTVPDVMKSKMISYPLKELDCKPVSDGACALILASEEKAKALTSKPVWITGFGNCYDAHYTGDRDLSDCDSLRIAAQKAYAMAGITDPSKEIDLAEISEEFSYQELLWMEGLGLCKRGEAGKCIQDGMTKIKGRLPVNPSGGVLSGNPSGVAGIVRVAEAFLQLSGRAGEREIAKAQTALAHGVQGPSGQSHCVIILKR
jgi:acetyl-CoA C-acetyltransferase